MSLQEQIPSIVSHIRKNRDFIDYNQKVFNILEGDLLSVVEELIDADFLVKTAAQDTKKRVPPINLFARIVDKLSKLYSIPPIRKTENETDQEIMDWYVEKMKVDTFFGDANHFFNAAKVGLLEPYLTEGDKFEEPNLRSFAPHQFLAYSDNVVNPLEATVIIKQMGEAADEKGDMKRIYSLTSATEFLVINEEGKIQVDKMLDENGEIITENPFGIINSTYINKSRHLLIPKPDSDSLRMATLIPMLLGDLNVAIKYLSHSMIIAIDAELGNVERNPGTFVELHSGTDEGGNALKPSVETIEPSVDVDKVIKLINYMVSTWLETRSIRPGSTGKSSDSAVSGISLMVQNSDTTENRKEQMIYFEQAEKEFWSMMKVVHNQWAKEGRIEERRTFSEDFSVSVQYAEMKPNESPLEKVEKYKGMKELGIFSKVQAVREFFPQWDDEEIDAYLMELEEEAPIFRIEGMNGEATKDNDQDQ